MGAMLTATVLLASLGVGTATLPAAAAGCTFTFPRTGGVYDEPVVDGDVLCGGPGVDRVVRMEGGAFFGRGGRDRIRRMLGGTFIGGRGGDQVFALRGGTFIGGQGSDRAWWLHLGTFVGGRGPDGVASMVGGSFQGGLDDDLVVGLRGGVFDGGDGDDEVPVCLDSPPAHHLEVELVASQGCTSAMSAHGRPVRSPADEGP
jgi:hypothetical protein